MRPKSGGADQRVVAGPERLDLRQSPIKPGLRPEFACTIIRDNVLDLGLHGWFTVFACAVQLTYGILSFAYGGRSRGVGLPLGLLCLCIFGWNFADLAREQSHQFAWRYLDVTLAPLTAGFTCDYVIGFMGERRRLRLVVWLVYLYTATVALAAGSSFFSEAGRLFATSRTYTISHVVIIVLVASTGFVLVYRHWQRHTFGLERLRTRLLIVGALFQTFVGTMELWRGFGIHMPRLASFGTLVSLSLFFVLTFRLNLLEVTVPIRLALYTMVVAVVSVVSYLIVLQAFSADAGALVVGTLVIVVGAAVAIGRIWSGAAQERARLEKLAFLGRVADQMAHDLRNPLTVIMNAAHFLAQDVEHKGSTADPEKMIPEIVDQARRIDRMISMYRRIGRIELARAEMDLNELLREAIHLADLSTDARVITRTDLSGRRSPCRVDRDLLMVTLENLTRNAIEAMPDGGELYVGSSREKASVLVVLRDTGIGMNARTLESCFEEMFTTKVGGSGLGLPFARQVVEAHGGEIAISSSEGRGTEIRLRLPLAVA